LIDWSRLQLNDVGVRRLARHLSSRCASLLYLNALGLIRQGCLALAILMMGLTTQLLTDPIIHGKMKRGH
jgi:hypothetical protein